LLKLYVFGFMPGMKRSSDIRLTQRYAGA
jgi:hypothetical protein